MFKECINEILKDYGQDVEIFLGNELLAKTKAFLRPLNKKSDFFKEKMILQLYHPYMSLLDT